MEIPDYLIYIIVAVIYGLGALKRAFNKEDKEPPPIQDPEEAERARKIQESIRRRIKERQEGKQAHHEEEIAEEATPPPLRPVHRQESEIFPEAVAVEEVVLPAFDYEAELNKRRASIQVAEQKLHQVKQLSKGKEVGVYKKPQKNERKELSLIRGLKNSSELKKAFIYQEILGTPKSMQRR